MVRVREQRKNGFTLVEALVAGIILSVALVILHAATFRCLTQTSRNEMTELAWQELDKQLVSIDLMGIDTFVEMGEMEGQIEAEVVGKAEPLEFFWKADVEMLDLDSLYELKLTLSWEQDRAMHSISAVTMFNGESLLTDDPLSTGSGGVID